MFLCDGAQSVQDRPILGPGSVYDWNEIHRDGIVNAGPNCNAPKHHVWNH